MEASKLFFNKTYDTILNEKTKKYYENLSKLENLHINDFALYTPINSIQRFLVRYELMKIVQNIPGAIIEMGVFDGNGIMSLLHIHNILQPTYTYREFYGFDTFQGFKDIDANDINNIVWEKGHYKCSNSYEKLQEIIDIHSSYYYRPSNVKLINGDVCETLPKFLEENKHVIISLLYLDMDLYQPTKVALKNLLPRMAKGSIIVFDELNFKSFPGETIAVLEELGVKYKFVNLLNSHINYCVIE
jgi:hypothetical protein